MIRSFNTNRIVLKRQSETILERLGSESGYVELPEVSVKAPGSELQHETLPEAGVDNFTCYSINVVLPEESSMFNPREKVADTMYCGHEVHGS